MTRVRLEKYVSVGIDRNEHSGVVPPDQPIVCQFMGHSDEELKDLHEQFRFGTLMHYELPPQLYKIVSLSSSGRLILKLDQ